MKINDLIALIAIIATNLGTVLTLYFQNDKKIEENRKETNSILEGIRQDMKDFHGRLERQDAEFRGALLLLEEKIRMKNG